MDQPAPCFTVRRARPRDVTRITEFMLAEAREAEGRAPEPGVVERGVAGAIGGEVPHCWVLCVSNGEAIVGCCSVYVEWSDWHAAPYWWVQSFFLAPEVRGLGLAQVMIDHLSGEARTAGAVQLRLYAHRRNGRALAAYRKAGFTTTDYEVLVKPL